MYVKDRIHPGNGDEQQEGEEGENEFQKSSSVTGDGDNLISQIFEEDAAKEKKSKKTEIQSFISFSALSEIHLPIVEQCIYHLVYFGLVFYSMYCLYLQINDPDLIKKLNTTEYPLKKGIFGLYREPGQNSIRYRVSEFIPYLKRCAFYLLISRISGQYQSIQMHNFICTAVSCTIALYLFSLKGFLFIMSITTLSIGLAKIGLHKVTVALCLLAFYFRRDMSNSEMIISYENDNANIFFVGFSLTLCRLISLSDFISNNRPISLFDYLTGYHYIFYPINFQFGLINFNNFLSQIKEPPQIKWKCQIYKTAKIILYIPLHFLINDMFHPHLYSWLAYRTDYIKTDRWGGMGMISLLALDFNLEYLQVYGWVNVIASLDKKILPDLPDCVFSNYRFSQIWRTFDRGLYEFMKWHIYVPLGGNKRGMLYKLICSLASFCFVAFYHGFHYDIWIWIVFNYIQILTEIIGGYLLWKSDFGNILTRYLSNINIRRLSAFLACLVYQLSVVGISFFWQGHRSALLFFTYMLNKEGAIYYLILINIGAYSLVNISIDCQAKKTKKKID